MTREINKLATHSHRLNESSECYGPADSTNCVHLSRKAAMKNVWMLLIWITVVAIESFLYSILELYLTGQRCEPIHVSQSTSDFFKFLDRFCGYSSWFIPLIWLYWPTKTHKQQNRR